MGDSCLACDPSTWEVEAGGLEIQGLSQLYSKFKASMHCVKSYVGGKTQRSKEERGGEKKEEEEEETEEERRNPLFRGEARS